MIDTGDSTISRFTLGLSAASLAGVLLAFAALAGGFTYARVAELAGIYDARASQTTELFAGTLALAWVIGTLVVGFNARVQRGASFSDTLLLSVGHRRLWSGAVGICVAAVLVGLTSVAVASTPSVVVTPPWAWISMTLACIAGAVVGIRVTDSLASRRTNRR